MPKFIVEISREDLDEATSNAEWEGDDASYIQATLSITHHRFQSVELESIKVEEIQR